MRALLVLLALMPLSLFAGESLRVPTRGGIEQPYYRELLLTAVQHAGLGSSLQTLAELPNRRADAMLENGELDVYWYIGTPTRDKRFLRVDVPLTEGMIAKRILLISPVEQARFAQIRSLADFQRSNVVAAMGSGWADVKIWQHNQLRVEETPVTLAGLYKLVASGQRQLDYLSRGAIEVEAEKDLRQGLLVEPHLLLSYPGDFYFYVTPRKPELRAKLEAALRQLESSGQRHKLFMQHYGAVLDRLALNKRTQITLQLPKP